MPARRRRPGPVLLVVAIVAVIALVAAAITVPLLVAGNDEQAAAQPEPPAAGGGEAPLVEDVIPEIARFVESERGLEFDEDPEVLLLDDEEFNARLTAVQEREEDPEQTAADELLLKALGLLPVEADLQEELDALLAAGVLGFYDPRTGELAVRGTEATPAVRSTIAHELVHALQDQEFDLDRPEYDERGDELGLGFTGLVEGDAVVVEEAYQRTMSPEDRRAARQPEGDLAPLLDAPQALLQLLVFPYQVGPPFVRAVLDERGQEGLDALFDDPPSTSEQLLDPQKFLAGEEPGEVPAPSPDGEAVDEGVIGQLGLLLMLSEELDAGTARSASDGWDADLYVTWRDGDRSCARVTVGMDTPADAAELRQALDDYAAELGPEAELSVVGSAPLTFTTCR